MNDPKEQITIELLHKLFKQLEDKVETLEGQIDDIDLSNLECKIDDLEAKVDDIEFDEIKSDVEELKENISNIKDC